MENKPLVSKVSKPLRKFLENQHQYKIEPVSIMTGLRISAFYAEKENVKTDIIYYLVRDFYRYHEFELVDKEKTKNQITMLFEKENENIEFEIKMNRYCMLNKKFGNFSFGNNDFSKGQGGFFTTIQLF